MFGRLTDHCRSCFPLSPSVCHGIWPPSSLLFCLSHAILVDIIFGAVHTPVVSVRPPRPALSRGKRRNRLWSRISTAFGSLPGFAGYESVNALCPRTVRDLHHLIHAARPRSLCLEHHLKLEEYISSVVSFLLISCWGVSPILRLCERLPHLFILEPNKASSEPQLCLCKLYSPPNGEAEAAQYVQPILGGAGRRGQTAP